MQRMLGMRDLKPQDLHGLTPSGLTALAAQMLEHIGSQARQLDLKDQQIERQSRDIAWRDAKLEKVNFELARLKRWRFGAKTEAMTAEQRLLFQDTLAEDEASLRAQLAALQAGLPETPKAPKAPRAKPRRQALPEHLERVEHRHEPEDTACPTAQCGQPMQRIGEDVSEKLDIIPAKFFVHRHIYGKWAWPVLQSTWAGSARAGARRTRCGGRRHPGQRAGGAHADLPLRRSPAVLPARRHQRPLGRAHTALDAVVVGRRRWRGT